MKILGIESSCDETAAAVVEDGCHVLSNVVVSQIDIFAAYGGVIPEVAARSHLEAILPVVDKALQEANCTWNDIDAIAVTHAPGLLGSLLIGTLTARTLAILHNKPLYPVHHLKSHIYATWLEGKGGVKDVFASLPDLAPSRRIFQTAPEGSSQRDGSSGCPAYDAEKSQVASKNIFKPPFPILALVASGGHTQLLYMPSHNHFEIIGTTRDDAIGECFDKVAKILGLPYPGGPAISAAATAGDPTKYRFPHPSVPGLDFSFSGLKTAVLRSCQELAGGDFRTPSHELAAKLTEEQKQDLAASFEATAIDILIEKLRLAYQAHPDANSVVIAGGVSANHQLRDRLRNCDTHSYLARPGSTEYVARHNHYMCPELLLPVFFPARQYSGDNGAMVASAAFYEVQAGVAPKDPYHIDIYPRTPIK